MRGRRIKRMKEAGEDGEERFLRERGMFLHGGNGVECNGQLPLYLILEELWHIDEEGEQVE